MMKSTVQEMAPSPPPRPSTKVVLNSLPSRKRLLSSPHLNSRKSPAPPPPPPPNQSRKPNISKCHSCNSQQISCSKGGGKYNNYKLQLLDSQWRVVLLCNSCFDAVQSAKNCSYCFLGISESVYSCWNCGHRVHKGCVSNYNGLSCCSNADSFTCIDCWVPTSGVRACCSSRSSSPNNEGFKTGLLGSCSSRSLEDMVKDANLTAERKVSAALRARDNASKKAVVARKAASMAAIALGLFQVDCSKGTQVKDSLLSSSNLKVVDDDVELKRRLHHVIKNSPRIFKSMHLGNSDPLVVLKKLNFDGPLVSSKSDPGKRSTLYQKLEVCNVYRRITKKRKNAISKPSACIRASDCCLFNPSFFEPRAKGNQEKKCEENGVDGVVGNFESETEASLPQVIDCKDAILELPVEEEQSNSSNKLDEFCRSNIGINSGSYGHEESTGFEKVLLNGQEEKWNKPDCKNLLKYSMRHKILKDAILELPVEEEQSNSSNKLDEFCRSNIGINSGSYSHEESTGFDKVLLNGQEEKWNKPDCKYLLKYSMRHKILKDAVLEFPVEEEQSNSSNKLDEFCGGIIGMNSGSHGHEEWKGLDKVLLNDQEEKWKKPDNKYLLKYSMQHKILKAVPISSGTCSQSSCDKDLFEAEEKMCVGDDKYLYKYTKRQRNL